MIEQFSITIDCLSDEERNLTIFVPDSFEKDPSLRYPVLYMNDGQNIFFDEDATYGKSWGMYDYLMKNHRQIIVVGIDSSRNPDNTRLCEYSPYTYDDFKYGHIKSKGKTYVKWIIEELKPFIDENYPTLQDRRHTFIGGSSMGGLIGYYALLNHNDIFSKAACLSPSLWVDNEKLVALAKRSKCNPETMFYFDYGSNERNGRFGKRAFESFWNCMNVLKDKNVTLNIRVIEGGSHCEASWEKQVPVFMPLLLEESI